MEQQIEFWSFETLTEFAQTTKSVEVDGKSVLIKKLPASIMEGTGKESTFMVMEKGLAKPKLTADQIKQLPIDFVKRVSEAIVEFSGVDLEKAEKN